MTEPDHAQEMTPTLAARPARPALRELAGIAATLLTLALVAVAAVWPWRSERAAVSETLARYAPSSEGRSMLSLRQDAAGQVELWQSVNRRHLRSAAAYATEINAAQREAIQSLYLPEGQSASGDEFLALVADAELIHERVTEVDATGRYTQTLNLRLRNARGEFVASLDAAAPDRELILTPPLPVLPPRLADGERWQGAGRIGAQGTYTIEGVVTRGDSYQGPLGASDDCLEVAISFVISVGEQRVEERRWTDTYCAGIGLTQEVETNATTGAVTRWVTLAANGANGASGEMATLPELAASEEVGRAGPVASAKLTRAGRYSTGIDTAATIAPEYLPHLDALLVASHDGDLLALDASTGFVDPLWRFTPGGTVFGQPAVDARTGRIYFGASDKRLYALDARGLYLWSFLTGDNVATRPVISGELVIFGSEDRSLYAVDRASGALRWRRETGAAVVSSPALVTTGGRMVVIAGSDDGAAYGLDARSGEVLWTHDTGAPVEAPVVISRGLALVASTAGSVTALDPATGEERWTADLNERPVRFAPAVAEDRLFVVDQQGYLGAYSLADGRRLWQSLEFDHVAAPLLVDGRLFVAASGGVVHEVDLDGRRVAAWRMTDASDATDTTVRLDFGPVFARGAVWTVDNRSVLRRLGADTGSPAALRLDWARGVNEPPFAMDLLRAAPVRFGELALAVDEGGRVVEMDPATGAMRLLFRAPVEATRIEPVIAGELLVLTGPQGLSALRLSDGSVAWQAAGGTSVRPPAANGDTILWSAAIPDGAGARVVALDAATGEVRWERSFPGVALPGGVEFAGEALFTAAPVARLDPRTGETVWEAPELSGGTGSPALSADGRVVYLGRVDPMSGGEVVALSASDGSILWRAALGGHALSLFDRPAASGDRVVVPTLGGALFGLDARTGEVLWQSELPAPVFGAVTVAEGRIYAALTDGEVVGLSAQDGRAVLRGGDREGGLEGYAFAQRPLLLGDRLIVSFGSSMRGYRAAGGR
jgi:outer membrane protein assembly factor BamB